MTLKELATCLETLREEKMLSVREFSNDLGFSALTYARIVRGESVFLRAGTLRKIQKKLQLPGHELSTLMRKQ